jgi:hypothetical protein
MSIQKKLEAIEKQEEALEEKKQQLLIDREADISKQLGKFAKKLEILTVDDDILFGALALIKNAIEQNNDEELQRLKKLSAPFRRKKRSK